MQQSLVPVLLLATVALSSSNILPVMSNAQLNLNTRGIDGQLNDNTMFSNRFNPDVLNNIFYTATIGTSQNRKKYTKYDFNNDRAEDRYVDFVKEDNYDGEGFRKEQWHNYPRQLDRLHKYLFQSQNVNDHIPEPQDNENANVNDEPGGEVEKTDNESNEYVLNRNENVQDMYGANVPVDPLLILKIHLACLSKQMKNSGFSNLQRFENKHYEAENDEKDLTNHINPEYKVTQEGAIKGQHISDTTVGRKNKRLFSLWSRLQTLSHKGHQLPHRRHLAFYGLQNSEGGRDLTAETRATLMRPPGSPLRWG